MDDEDNICQICLEQFNTNNKVPKILECCQFSCCLSCLQDIYKKQNNKLICPICRKLSYKNPKDLKINKEKLQPSLVCPSCHRGIAQRDQRINVSQQGHSSICCLKCTSEHLSHDLSDYLVNVTEEMSFFINLFCNFSTESIQSILDFQINSCIDYIFQKIKNGIHSKIKAKLLNEISLKYEIDPNNFSSIMKQFSEFKSNCESLNKMKNVNIKNNDYPVLKSHVDYYIYNSEIIKKNGMKLKKIYENINKYDCVSFNKMLVDYEDIENFLAKFFDIKICQNGSQSEIVNEYNFDTLDKFNTGIKFIDIRISHLIKENENLYENFLKRDLQFKKLEREFEAIKKSLNEKVVFENSHNCVNSNHLYDNNRNSVNNVNTSFNNFNINLNDIEFKIINSNNDLNLKNEICVTKSVMHFNPKNLFVQNFNFTINNNKVRNIISSINLSKIMNIDNFLSVNHNELGPNKIKEENHDLNNVNEIEKNLFSFDFND